MIDRVFANAVDADGRPLHIAVKDGRFASLGAVPVDAPAAETVDLQGRLVLPGFVDGHIHLDKSFVGDPPQEEQGLYGVFDTDASTLAVIAEHAAAVKALG